MRADTYTGHTLVGLRGGRAYLFRARAVNGLGVRVIAGAARFKDRNTVVVGDGIEIARSLIDDGSALGRLRLLQEVAKR